MATSEKLLKKGLHEHKSLRALHRFIFWSLFFAQTPSEIGIVPSMCSSFSSGSIWRYWGLHFVCSFYGEFPISMLSYQMVQRKKQLKLGHCGRHRLDGSTSLFLWLIQLLVAKEWYMAMRYVLYFTILCVWNIVTGIFRLYMRKWLLQVSKPRN